MIRKPIGEASVEELRAFAETFQGLEVDGRVKTPESLIAIIRNGGWDMEHIVLTEEVEPVAGGERNASTRPRIVNGEEVGREVQIKIHSDDSEDGDADVFVSVNGKAFQIKRGVDVWVPVEVEEALRNAIELHYPKFTGAVGEGLGEPRSVQAYPYSLVA